jgi:hypothetical protein
MRQARSQEFMIGGHQPSVGGTPPVKRSLLGREGARGHYDRWGHQTLQGARAPRPPSGYGPETRAIGLSRHETEAILTIVKH